MNPATQSTLSAPTSGQGQPVAEPTAAELESRQLALMLKYAMGALSQALPDWLCDAAQSPRGDLEQSPIMVDLLRDLCAGLTEGEARFVLGNGRNPHARALAIWYAGQLEGPHDQAVS